MEDAIRIIEGLDTSNSEENIEAKKMAVAAMMKQIHKKVIKKECEGEEITKCLCPTCEEVLRSQWDDGFIIGCKKTYCDKCGQRLDWSDYMTKGDKIRSMSDKELSRELCKIAGVCADCIAQDMCYEGHNGFEKWVKEEVNEDE